MEGVEFVTDRQWDSYARRLERKCLREHGRSLSAASIARAAAGHILEIRSDQKGSLVRPGWREAMKTRVEEASRKDGDS